VQGPPGPTAIQDEGTALPGRAFLNFVGAGVVASDDAGNNRTVVTVSGAPVTTVFGRSGAVVAQAGDYTAAMVTGAVADPTTTKGDLLVRGVAAATSRLGIGGDGQVLTADSGQPLGMHWATPAAAGVSTVFGRSGAVVAQANDYTAAQVTNAVSILGSYADPAWITSLAWSKIAGAPSGLDVRVNSTTYGIASILNLIAGTNVTLGATSASGAVNVTFNATGAAQTPWTQNINAGHFDLTNLNGLFFSSPPSPTWSFVFNNQGGTLTLRRDDTWATLTSVDGSGNFFATQLAARSATDLNQNMTLSYDGPGDYGKLEVYHAGTGYRPLAVQPSGGNVGIGKINPGYKLDVSGDCNLSSGSIYRINGVDIRGWAQTPWQQNVNANGFQLSNALTVNATSSLGVSSGTGATAITNVAMLWSTSGSLRWNQFKQDTESGSNSGSNLYIGRYDDAGNYMGTPILINRATGVVNFEQTPTIAGTSILSKAQSPWLQNVNAAGFTLANVSAIATQSSTNAPAVVLNGATAGWASGIQFNNTTASIGRNYGMYSDSGGNFQFVDQTSGTALCFFNASHFLRIGSTLQPGYMLDVAGDINSYGGVYRINGVDIRGWAQTPWQQNINANAFALFGASEITVTGGIDVLRPLPTQISWYTSGNLRWSLQKSGTESGSNAGSNLLINRYDDAGALLSTCVTIIRSTGRVAIGQTTATQLLDVAGNIQATNGNLGASNISADAAFVSTSAGMSAIYGTSSSAAYFGSFSNIPLRVITNSTEQMRILATGLVGIGTTNPISLLFTNGAGQAVTGGTLTYPTGNQTATVTIQDTATATGSGGMVVFGGGVGGFAAIKGLLQVNTGNGNGDLGIYMRFAAADTTLYEAVRILSDGKFGVGTYPAYKLDVSGDINGSAGLRLPGLPTTNPGAGSKRVWCDTAAGNVLKLAV